MTEEIWKSIKGYKGYYEISSLGRIKSLRRKKKHVAKITGKVTFVYTKERILRPQKDACGYLHIKLSKNGKERLYKLHILVATAFLGYNRKQYNRKNVESLVVDHLNGIKTCNEVSNLSVCTQLENIRRYVERRRRNDAEFKNI